MVVSKVLNYKFYNKYASLQPVPQIYVWSLYSIMISMCW